jgi:hypothetical protein
MLKKVPQALALSQHRRRHFRDSGVYHKLFD